MARPLKHGLDYFPLDCNFDNKVRALIGKYKAKGFGIFVHLLQLIYNNGYFLKINEEVKEDIAIEMGEDESFIDEVINFSCKRNIFSIDAYNKNILTSHGIQKRFTEATKRRKDFNIVSKFKVNADNNLINVDNKPLNESNGTQRKEKKRKEEESIANGINFEYSEFSKDVQVVIKEWLDHKEYDYKERGWKSWKTILQKGINVHGEDVIILRIHQALSESWKGLNIDKMDIPVKKQSQSSGQSLADFGIDVDNIPPGMTD